MPRYYFTIRSCDDEDYKDERCAVLQDVDAALRLSPVVWFRG